MIIVQKLLDVYGNTIDQPFLNANSSIDDFPADDNNNNNALFKFKTKIAGRTGNNGRRDVKNSILLKYLSNF